MEVQEEKIRKIFREELNNFLETLLLRMKFENLPFVSDEEQKDIESLYGKELLADDEQDIVYSSRLEIWAGNLNIRGMLIGF